MLEPFLRVEEGPGETVLDGVRSVLRAGFATGTVPLKLYTLFAPPNRRDGIHHTLAAAEADHERFDGKTTA